MTVSAKSSPGWIGSKPLASLTGTCAAPRDDSNLRPTAGWSGVVLGFLVALAAALEPLLHFNKSRDRSRRVDAYRKRLRDRRIPPNIEPEARQTPS